MADWEFETEAFRDTEEARGRNVNGIEGAALAEAARAHLEDRGFACGEVFPEDFGWVFDATGAEGRYLCAFSLEPGEGDARTGHATVEKHRSLGDRLLGRNRGGPGEAVPQAVGAFLRAHPAIRGVSDGSA